MKSLKTALKQIRRTPYQALAASAILSLTFFAVAVFIPISAGFHLALRYVESSPQVIAFFEKGKDLENKDIDRIRTRLAATGKLASFQYVSTREAVEIYKSKNLEDPLLNELVDERVLPPSIEISATEISALPELRTILDSEPLVEDLDFYEDIVNKATIWITNIRVLGLGMIGFLLLLSVLILVVIIGMKIKNKRVEIEIMRLIGASGWYILGPFLVEGIIYGLVGAFFGWLGAFTVLQYSTPLLLENVGEFINLPINFTVILLFLGVLTLSGALIGALGSLIAVRRFIKI
jgi:cell division transport system permease protein